MKFQVLQENLKNSVALTSHFVSSKAQLPILGNILIKAYKSKLTLSATNLETSVTTSIAAKIEEEGEITVNGKTLNDVVSNLSSGALEIEVSKEQLKLASGTFKSNILGSNSSDFPSLPTQLLTDSVKIERSEFVESLSKVLFAVSNDETRPILTGVLVIIKDNRLYLVSTDGFRLSEVKMKKDVESSNLKIIVPKAILNELVKIDGENIEFSFDKENNQIIFLVGDTILSSRIIEGEFPDYEKIIPTSSIASINVDKNEFEKSIKLASVFARDSGNIIKLVVSQNILTIKAESTASGNQETNIEIRNEEKDEKITEIMFNYRFIEEYLKTVRDDELQIQISDNNKASKFIDPKSNNFLHIIMPIKTQN